MSTEPAEVGHNSRALDELIRTHVKAQRDLDSQITRLNDRRKTLRSQFRTDTGLKLGVLDNAVHDADLENDEDRKKRQEMYWVVYRALRPGEMIDFTKIDELAAEVVQADPEAAKKAGKKAGLAGTDSFDNPYPEDDAANKHWHAGWLEGQKELAGAKANTEAVAAS